MKAQQDQNHHSVMLIAFHYPPIQMSSGVHGAVAFSRYLAEHNWDVDVLTVNTTTYEQTNNLAADLLPDNVKVIRCKAWDTARDLSRERALFFLDGATRSLVQLVTDSCGQRLVEVKTKPIDPEHLSNCDRSYYWLFCCIGLPAINGLWICAIQCCNKTTRPIKPDGKFSNGLNKKLSGMPVL